MSAASAIATTISAVECHGVKRSAAHATTYTSAENASVKSPLCVKRKFLKPDSAGASGSVTRPFGLGAEFGNFSFEAEWPALAAVSGWLTSTSSIVAETG